MSLTVVLRVTATADLARLRGADKDAFRRARRAVASLAADPRPDGAVPWGNSGIWRLHAGDVRVVYEVDEDAEAVYILSVGIVS